MKRFNPWSISNFRWIVRHRAWSWYYFIRYLRFVRLHLFGPRNVVCEGFVFLGKRVELHAHPERGRLVIAPWVHIGDDSRMRAHEGTLRIHEKTVFGRDTTINAFLDITIGSECIISDSVYLCDFDHVMSDTKTAIRHQGIIKSPVRIGNNCWIGTKVTVLRGSRLGDGSVIGANSVVKGTFEALSVVGGVPARVIRNRGNTTESHQIIDSHRESVREKTLLALDSLIEGATDRTIEKN